MMKYFPQNQSQNIECIDMKKYTALQINNFVQPQNYYENGHLQYYEQQNTNNQDQQNTDYQQEKSKSSFQAPIQQSLDPKKYFLSYGDDKPEDEEDNNQQINHKFNFINEQDQFQNSLYYQYQNQDLDCYQYYNQYQFQNNNINQLNRNYSSSFLDKQEDEVDEEEEPQQQMSDSEDNLSMKHTDHNMMVDNLQNNTYNYNKTARDENDSCAGSSDDEQIQRKSLFKNEKNNKKNLNTQNNSFRYYKGFNNSECFDLKTKYENSANFSLNGPLSFSRRTRPTLQITQKTTEFQPPTFKTDLSIKQLQKQNSTSSKRSQRINKSQKNQKKEYCTNPYIYQQYEEQIITNNSFGMNEKPQFQQLNHIIVDQQIIQNKKQNQQQKNKRQPTVVTENLFKMPKKIIQKKTRQQVKKELILKNQQIDDQILINPQQEIEKEMLNVIQQKNQELEIEEFKKQNDIMDQINQNQEIQMESPEEINENSDPSQQQQQGQTQKTGEDEEQDDADLFETQAQRDLYQKMKKNIFKNVTHQILSYIETNKKELSLFLNKMGVDPKKFFKKYKAKNLRVTNKQQFTALFYIAKSQKPNAEKAENEKKALRMIAYKFLRYEMLQYCLFMSRIVNFDIFIRVRHRFIKLLQILDK